MSGNHWPWMVKDNMYSTKVTTRSAKAENFILFACVLGICNTVHHVSLQKDGSMQKYIMISAR